MTIHRFAIVFLLAQAIGAGVWWILLLSWPASREPFMASNAPASTLLAFGVPDGLLFIGISIVCAYGFSNRSAWAWPMLCVHAGASAYASLYCWSLVALTHGNGLLGAMLMTPSLIIPGLLVWKLRPVDGAKC